MRLLMCVKNTDRYRFLRMHACIRIAATSVSISRSSLTVWATDSLYASAVGFSEATTLSVDSPDKESAADRMSPTGMGWASPSDMGLGTMGWAL